MHPGHTARLIVALSLAAAAAAAQPGFDKAFEPSTIGPGSVSAAVFTISNDGPEPVTALAFSDTLPAPVTIAEPANVISTCALAQGGSLVAPAGGSTITLAGGQIGAGSSCTISVDVTSSTPGTHTNPAITLSSSAGESMSAAEDLLVATDRPGFTKGFAPSSVALGGRSTLTLTIDNSANGSALSSIVFSDNFPTGLVVADPSRATSDCGGLNPLLTVGVDFIAFSSFGQQQPGLEVLLAGETCTVAVDVVAAAGGALDNVTGELSTNAGSSGKAGATLDVSVSTLALDKEFADDPVAPNSLVTLDFTVSNFDRDFAATNVTFTDDLSLVSPQLAFEGSVMADDCGGSVVFSNADTLLTVSGISLPAQASCTIRLPVIVPPALAPGSYLNTTSAVSGTLDGSAVLGNMASDTLFVEPAPRLSKSFLAESVNPGDTVVLEFEVSNISGDSAATDIEFSDPLPPILPAASATPGDDCCGAGSTCTFTPLVNPPPPADAVPATLTLSGGTVPAGGTCTFQLTLDVQAEAPPGVYTNTTSPISAAVGGVTYTGDPATDDLVVNSAPALTKAFLGDPAEPGGTVTLQFELSHPADAASAASDITFTDDLAAVLTGLTASLPPSPDPPCGSGSTLTASANDTLLTLMGGSLAPGESCIFSVTLNVPVGAAAGPYTNTTSGVSAMVGGQATVSAPASADFLVSGITLRKQFIGGPALPGGQITLRFTLENTDPVNDATSITFTDDLAAVLPGLTSATTLPISACGGTLFGPTFLIFVDGALAQGDPPCVIDLVLDVPAMAADGLYNNVTDNTTATVDGQTVILPPASASFEVDSNRISLEKVFTDDPVAPGGTVNLRFMLSNLDGAQSIASITFSDDLEAALPGLEANGLPIATCGGTLEAMPDLGHLLFSGGSLMPSEVCSFDVSLTVPADAQAGDYTNVTGPVSGSIGATEVTGDPAAGDLSVLNLLTFSKFFGGPATAGGTVTLNFTISNPGTSEANSVAFSDDLDAVLAGLVASNLPLDDVCGAGSQLSGTGFLTLGGASLPPMGGTCAFAVELQMPPVAAGGDYLNMTSDLTAGGLQVSPPATATLTVLEEQADLGVVKSGPAAVTVGQTLAYAIEVTNDGPDPATGVVLADPTPSGLTFLGAGAPCAGGFPCDLGSIDNAASVTVNVTFDVPGDYSGPDPIENTATVSAATGDANADNDSSTASTDVIFDAVAPIVTGVQTAAGPLAACDTVRQRLQSIDVAIEDALSAIQGADQLSNYLLLAPGPDGDFSTSACGAAAGDDVALAVHSLSLTGGGTAAVSVSLAVGGPLGLDPGLYRLLVCDTITDAAGNALDGDTDQVPGGDFVLPFFRADRFNAFANGHFDDCPVTLSPWLITATPPNTVQTGVAGNDDVDGSPLSSSARILHLVTGASSLGQCVAVSGPVPYTLAAQARFLPLAATAATLVSRCELFDGAACGGSSLGVFSGNTLLEDQGGAWIAISREIVVPAGAATALCDFAVEPAAGGPEFELFLDALFFGPNAAIFTDGFESGDVSAWSASFP